jgi:hypothetical protein
MNTTIARLVSLVSLVAVTTAVAMSVGGYLQYTRERNAIFNALYNIRLHAKKYTDACAGQKSHVEQHAESKKLCLALRGLDLEACPHDFSRVYDEYVEAMEGLSDLLGDVAQAEAGVDAIKHRQFVTGLYQVAAGLSAVPSAESRATKCSERLDGAIAKMNRIAADYGLRVRMGTPEDSTR